MTGLKLSASIGRALCHNDTVMSCKVLFNPDIHKSGHVKNGGDFGSLTTAGFEKDKTLMRKAVSCLPDNGPKGVTTILSAIQGNHRIMTAHFCFQKCDLPGGYIGRIGNNKVKLACQMITETGSCDQHPVFDIVAFGVFASANCCRCANIGQNGTRIRQFGKQCNANGT